MIQNWTTRTLTSCLCLTMVGCATWMPSGEQPAAPMPGIKTPGLSNEAVVIETILLRLNSDQSSKLEELWNVTDQQILETQARIQLDRNGIRLGKVNGTLPALLEGWVVETEKRLENDPLEQTGLASDANSVSRIWRCKSNQTKEIPLRSLESKKISLFYHDEVLKGKDIESPRFYFAMNAVPGEDYTATVRLYPEVAFGEYRSRVVARDAALRQVSERDTLSFLTTAVNLRLKRGECLVIGPTSDRRGLGAEFLTSKTQDGALEPLLLLVRLSASGVDSNFAPNEVARAQKYGDPL